MTTITKQASKAESFMMTTEDRHIWEGGPCNWGDFAAEVSQVHKQQHEHLAMLRIAGSIAKGVTLITNSELRREGY